MSIKAAQPKPEEAPAEAKTEPKKRRGKKGKSAKKDAVAAEAQASAPEPTAMEIAWQEAMARAESKKAAGTKKSKIPVASKEQEDILSRTLENRLPTS